MYPFQRSSILTQLRPTFLRKPRKTAILGLAGLCVSGAVTAIAVSLPDESVRISVPLTAELTDPDTSVVDLPPLPYTRETSVRTGETTLAVFSRLGINDPVLMAFIQLRDEGRKLVAQIRPGSVMEARTLHDGSLQSLLIHPADSEQALELFRHDDTFSLRATTLPVITRQVSATATISASLFAAMDELDLPDEVTTSLAEIFSNQINFHNGLRRGDRVSVIYEAVYYKGILLRTGRILAAEFVNRGHSISAVWFAEGSTGGGAYYTARGQGLHKGFLRSPLEYTRISAGFAEEDHPFLQSWQQHKGTDFAAPVGTKVRAASDGMVDFVGPRGGYGNFIILRHAHDYSTAYGHLNEFAPGITKGMHVKQGDVIGFVGMTGWATGPHLHYELRVKGEQIDPMTAELPSSTPLAGARLQAFRAQTAPLLAHLNMNKGMALASGTVVLR